MINWFNHKKNFFSNDKLFDDNSAEWRKKCGSRLLLGQPTFAISINFNTYFRLVLFFGQCRHDKKFFSIFFRVIFEDFLSQTWIIWQWPNEKERERLFDAMIYSIKIILKLLFFVRYWFIGVCVCVCYYYYNLFRCWNRKNYLNFFSTMMTIHTKM